MAAVCAAGPLPMMTTFSAMEVAVYQRFFAEDSGRAQPRRGSLGPMEDRACLAQLERSHRRHDDVLAGLLEAARRLAAGRPHDTDVDVVHNAVGYFDRSVRRHFL